MRLVLARAVAAKGLLSSAVVVALVATTLITLFLLLAWLQPIAGIRTAFSEAPDNERTVLVTAEAGSDAEVAAARDAAVRELLDRGLAGVELPVFSAGRAIGHRLPDAGQDTLIMFLPELADHAQLVEGAWPAPTTDDAPVQVVLPERVADHLGVGAGDEVEVQDWVRQQDLVTQVVGVFSPLDPDAAYWDLTAGRLVGDDLGPLVVDREVFLERFRASSTLLWLSAPDPSHLATVAMRDVIAEGEGLQDRMIRARGEDPVWAQSTRMRLDLIDLAARLELSTVVQRSGLVLPAALLAVIATYALALLARLVAADRRGETALLRARGASRRQLATAAGVEGLLVVAPAAILSAPLATWAVAVLDTRVGSAGLDLASDLAAYGRAGPPLAWATTIVAAVGCAVALVLPAARRGRTWVAEQQERSRPTRGATIQRAGIDLVLVVLAVIAWLQLRQYGAGVAPRDVGGIGVDPVLTMAPVVAVLAVTVLALRLLPVATRLYVRLAHRREGFSNLLGAWQADRRPHAGPVVLLVLAVATAVLAPSVAATWQQSQRDQSAHEVGADLRVEGGADDVGAVAESLMDVLDVDAMMTVERSSVRLRDAVRVPRLAMESSAAGDVVRLRNDLAPEGVGTVFASLRDGLQVPEGIDLPHDAERISGQLTVTWKRSDGAVEARAPWLLVADGSGRVQAVRLPSPALGTPTPFEVEVPTDARTVVGVIGEIRYRSIPPVPDEEPPEPGTRIAAWELSDLSAGSAGAADTTPLDLPDRWDIDLGPTFRPGPRRPEPMREGPGRVEVGIHNQRHASQTFTFLLGEPGEVPVVPAIFSDAALAAAGGSEVLGTDIDLGEVTVQVVGTVPSLPGAGQDAAIVVDLAWLSQQQARTLVPPVAHDELWISTSSRAAVAERLSEHDVVVHDRDVVADNRLEDPQGAGVLQSLWVAAGAALALAAFGLLVDSRATAVRRRRELAFLHTLGTSPSALARALVVEQVLLAGLGVLAGIGVGAGVAMTMGPSLVMTPTGAVPTPPPLASFDVGRFVLPALALLVIALVLAMLIARRARSEFAAGALRIGED